MNHTFAGRRLALGLLQALWLFLAILAIGRFAFSIGLYARDIDQVCQGTTQDCHALQQPTPKDASTLQRDGLTLEQWAGVNIGFRLLITFIFCGVGFLIFWRKRDDGGALLISLLLVLLGTMGGFFGFLSARFPEWSLLLKLLEIPSFAGFPLLFFSFPNGRVVPRNLWLVWLVWVGFGLYDTFFVVNRSDPTFFTASAIIWPLMFVSGAASQVYRYLRVSNAVERRQTKWVMFAVVTVFGLVVGLLLLPPFSNTASDSAPYSAALLFVNAMGNLALSLVPLSVAIGIFKYRLYDIDIIIRRTLIYGLLTGLLALAYLGSVIVLQQLFRALTGQGDDLAIIISTLGIAALSIPLRNRVQGIIDRRFYRRKYNAAQILQSFAATARDEVDLNRLKENLVSVVEETMQPDHVSVWLRTMKDRGQKT